MSAFQNSSSGPRFGERLRDWAVALAAEINADRDALQAGLELAESQQSDSGCAPGDTWFITSRGRIVHPLALRLEEVDIEEIAHSLSNICRFNGHCSSFYSVAQHSVLVASELPDNLKLQGLLHDASEAFCGDVIRPIKRRLSGYAKIEADIWRVIAVKFSLPEELDPLVKVADNRMLLTEKRDLVAPHSYAWSEEQVADASAEPYPSTISPWSPAVAKRAFLHLFHVLRGDGAGA